MKINTKVKAFTILEVTVSMLLAVITISIAYTAYRVVSSSYRQFDIKNKKLAEFIITDKLLKKDISACNKMVRTIDGVSLLGNEGEIRYTFEADYILRNQFDIRTDTFFVKNADFISLFEKKEAFSGEMTDNIRFSADLEDKTVKLGYFKNYSAEQLFR
jgi:hypothetical protein